MKLSFDQFARLHQEDEPLLIANIWNAQSARLFEKLKFKALATSSAAVASTLGYSDGEQMSFDEYLFVVKRIRAVTSLPLSVDLEGGYGATADEVVSNVRSLSKEGVVGINIEDSTMVNGTRKILDASVFADKLGQISAGLNLANIQCFINVRCDAILLGLPDARKEAIRRIQLYEKQGVNGMFLPYITHIDDIKATVQSTKLPLNVMCMPALPDFETLRGAGVKRISMGNFLNTFGYSMIEKATNEIIQKKNFSPLF
jgi:2-methylisocitrate lyase-like PEP mutase family enzyme